MMFRPVIRVRHHKYWSVPIVAALLATVMALAIFGSYESRSAQAQTTTTSAVVVGAGDIASKGTNGDSRTANLLDNISGTVLAIGDNAYQEGTLTQFNNWYDPTW